MNQNCACICGATRFTIDGSPIGRFFCHCTICQKAYRKPFADVTLFWAESVAVPAGRAVEFRRHRRPPALRRGKCAKCNHPVVSLLGFPRSLTLAFVPRRISRDRRNCQRSTVTYSMTGGSPTSPTAFRRSVGIGRARLTSLEPCSAALLDRHAPPEPTRGTLELCATFSSTPTPHPTTPLRS
jgi:hypothetical protein